MITLSSKTCARLFSIIIQALFILALLLPYITSLPDVFFSYKYDRWNPDYKGMYQYIRDRAGPNDAAYLIPIQAPESWEQTQFLSVQFSYPGPPPFPLLPYEPQSADKGISDIIVERLEKNTPPPSRIFLVFEGSGLQEEAIMRYCTSKSNWQFFFGHHFFICTLTTDGPTTKMLESFFTGLISSLRDKNTAYRVFDILLRMAEWEKNQPKCYKHLSGLRQLKKEYPVIQKALNIHEEACRKILP